ncbi:MAG: transcription elongation factor Spt5 [Nanoarchaeota archaeon]
MTKIYALRTTANREEQVLEFVSGNAKKRNLQVYSLTHPHGMKGYIFIEAESADEVERAYHGVPYARGLLKQPVNYQEIEHMLEQAKTQLNMQINDIVEIISGPFKKEKAKITRIDKQKEEIIVELLEAAVPIPITVKMDSVKVIRREGEEKKEEDNE